MTKEIPSGPTHIASGEACIVKLPLRRPHFWAGNVVPGEGYVVFSITLQNGIKGWGETQPIKTWGGDFGRYYGEQPAITVAVIHNILLPAIVDCDIREIDNLHKRMDRALRGYPYAKAAVDVACHDALGKLLAVPVYQLLGGKVRDRIEIGHSIGLMDNADAVREAVEVASEGVKTIKLKIGLDAERDLNLVRDVRRAVGPNMKLRVDANQGYQAWRQAVDVLSRMQEYDVYYAEQPVEGIRNLALVRKNINLPVMADESAWTSEDVRDIVEHKAAEMISVYYTKPGGLAKAKQMLAIAGSAGLKCDINGSGEMGIGNAANLHLAASSPEIVLAGTIPITSTAEHVTTKVAGHKYLDDIVERPFRYRDGFLDVPDGPGLGIEVDEGKIARYRVG